MSHDGQPGERGAVLCPYCLDPVLYDPTALYTRDTSKQCQKLTPQRPSNPYHADDELRRTYQRCHNVSEIPEHYVPVPYLIHGRPLTVALVGSSLTGKTHLLTAIIMQIIRGGMDDYGLKWRSVNAEMHARFLEKRVQPLQRGEILEGTREAAFVDLENALLISGRNFTRPVAFFDIAGESLTRTDKTTRFLAGVDAFIFVVDPVMALRLPQLEQLRKRLGVRLSELGDPAFGTVLDRIPRTGKYLDVTAALVVSKSDLIRFDPPVDMWLLEPYQAPLSSQRIWRESRDVYAFLRHYGGTPWLRPFMDCRQCTLHFASATGAQARDSSFPRGVRPRRVLEPLLAIFAMNGLLGTGAGTPDLVGL